MSAGSNIEITFNNERERIFIDIQGRISIEDVTSAFRAILSSDNYQAGMPGIWDATRADLSEINHQDVETLANNLVPLSQSTGTPKVAVVSENPLNYCLLQLFKEHYSDGRTTLETFESFREAENWIDSRGAAG